MNQNKEQLLTMSQVAEFLNLKMSKLRSMVFKREIPVLRIGRCLRFSQPELMAWLKNKGLTV